MKKKHKKHKKRAEAIKKQLRIKSGLQHHGHHHKHKPHHKHKKKKSKQHPLLKLIKFGMFIAVWITILIILLLIYISISLPDIKQISRRSNIRPEITFLDTNNKVITTYGDSYNRVPLQNIPDDLNIQGLTRKASQEQCLLTYKK